MNNGIVVSTFEIEIENRFSTSSSLQNELKMNYLALNG